MCVRVCLCMCMCVCVRFNLLLREDDEWNVFAKHLEGDLKSSMVYEYFSSKNLFFSFVLSSFVLSFFLSFSEILYSNNFGRIFTYMYELGPFNHFDKNPFINISFLSFYLKYVVSFLVWSWRPFYNEYFSSPFFNFPFSYFCNFFSF